MRPIARALLVGAGVVVLLMGSVVLAALFIPAERVGRFAAERATEVLGVPVTIDGVRLTILPRPGVRITGVSAASAEGGTAIAAADAVELNARILPLFRGRVIIGRLVVSRPRAFLSIDEEGRPNLPVLRGGPDGETADEAETGSNIAFRIDALQVEEGRLAYRDARDGTAIRLDRWSQLLELDGHLEAGALATVRLTGAVTIDDIDARLPEVVLPTRNLSLAIQHDATLHPEAGRLELANLDVTLNGVRLSGTGRIDSLRSTTGRSAALRLTADADASELLGWAPDSIRDRLTLPDGRSIDVSGQATLRAAVDGPLSVDSLPRLDGALTVMDGRMSVAGETIVRELEVEAAFSFDSAAARIRGAALEEGFTVEVVLRDPAEPTVAVGLDAALDLRRLTAAELVPDLPELEGRVQAAFRAEIIVDRLEESQIFGTVRASSIRLPGTDPVLAVPEAVIHFSGTELDARPVRLALGPDAVPLTLTATVAEWIPARLDSTAAPPRAAVTITGDTLDLDALLGPSESEYPVLLFARLRDRPIDGRTAGEVAEEIGLAVPPLPPVRATIDATLGLVVRNELRYNDVVLRARSSPEEAIIEHARFGFMGGTVDVSARLEPVERDTAARPVRSRLDTRYALSGVGAEPFFDRLTPFRDHLSGELDLVGMGSMTLDRHALPERSTVAAEGTLAIADGELTNWRVLDAVGDRLGIATFDTIRFRDWVGRYRVAGPLVTLEETMLRGDEMDVRAAGSFDLGGRMDLGATLYLSRSLAARAGNVGEQIVAAAGTDGRVPVGVRITGPVESPAVSLDLSEARTALVDRARREARREGREAADRLAREAAEEIEERFELPDSLRGLPPDSLRTILGDSLYGLVPDSLKVPADSLAEKAERALRDRLRRLLPGGGGGGET